MDLALSEMQKALRQSVNDFLKNEWSLTQLRQMEKDGCQLPSSVYSSMGSLGFLGIMMPESYGGSAGSWLDSVVVHEEYGRALLRAPCFDTTIAGLIIQHLGDEGQRRRLLPLMCEGKLVVALGNRPAPGGEAKASRHRTGFKLEGTSLFVRYTGSADYVLVAGRVPGAERYLVFLVPQKSEGVTVREMRSFSGETVSEVTFSSVEVPTENALLGTPGGKDLADILASAEVLRCAEMIGGATVAMQLAVDYSKQRVQYGAPIGSYQALQHKMADMWLSIHKARWATYNWAWLMDQGNPVLAMPQVAQMTAREAYRRCVEDSVQIHGGYGVMTDFDITLYYRTSKVHELELAPSWAHKDNIATAIGL